MDDLSIEALTAALQSVQQQKSTARLSERNVVELVLKLQQLGLLDTELLYTVNGREYLTIDQLRSEVQALVDASGGRIAVVDIPAQLNVDLVHCERVAADLVAASNGTLQQAQGELLSVKYFDSLAAEVQELLTEAGATSIGDLARRFALSTELLTTAITARIGGVLTAKLESGMLYTPAYLARIKAQLRGALRAVLEPIYLQDITKSLGLEDVNHWPALLAGLTDELVKQGSIRGALRSGMWTPAVYVEAQQRQMDSFYNTNGYLTYTAATRCGITNPQQQLPTRFPGARPLATAVAGPLLVQQVDSMVQDALGGASWCDAVGELPPELIVEDVGMLLQSSAAVQHATEGGLYAGTCFVTTALKDAMQTKVLDMARTAAATQLAQKTKGGGAAHVPTASPKTTPGKVGSTPNKGQGDDDDDDWDMKKGGKKGGKKKAAGAKGKGGKGGTTASKGVSGPPGPSADDGAAALSTEAIADAIVTWEANMEGEQGDLPTILADHLRPAAIAEYEQQLRVVFTAGTEARRRRSQLAKQSLEHAHQRFSLYMRGVSIAQTDTAQADSGSTAQADTTQVYSTLSQLLARHLNKTVGTEMTTWLLRYMELGLSDTPIDDTPDAEWHTAAAHPPTATQRTQLLNRLPQEESTHAAAACAAVNDGDPQVLVAAVESAAAAAGLLLRPMDKKQEKAAFAVHQEGLRGALQGEEDAATVLSLVVTLLAGQTFGKALCVPGRAIAPLLTLLQPHLEEGSHKELEKYHEGVVASLRGETTAGTLIDPSSIKSLVSKINSNT